MNNFARTVVMLFLFLLIQNASSQEELWMPIFESSVRNKSNGIPFRLYKSTLNIECRVVAIPKSYYSTEYYLYVGIIMIEENRLVIYSGIVQEKNGGSQLLPGNSSQRAEIGNKVYRRFESGKLSNPIPKESDNFEKYCGPTVSSLPAWIKILFYGLFGTDEPPILKKEGAEDKYCSRKFCISLSNDVPARRNWRVFLF